MEKTVTVPKKKGKIRQFIPLYLMALPGLLYLLINNYLPMAGLTIAFRNVNYTKGIWKSDWCGLANFKYLFATKDAWVITRNTIGYAGSGYDVLGSHLPEYAGLGSGRCPL